MSQPAIYLLPLEETLSQDENGTAKSGLIAQLMEHANRVKKTLDTGVSPAEFTQLNQLHLALESAITVVEQVWQRLQAKP